MRNKRSPWLLIVLILSGALIGGLLSEFLAGNSFFAWMSFGGTNGYRELFSFAFNPLVDSGVIRLGFDLTLRVNAGSILGMILGVLIYMKV